MIDEHSSSDKLGPSTSLSLLMVGFAFLVIGGIAAFFVLRPSSNPPPAVIAGDSLLVEGRAIFLDRCASCHGATGKGDGPTSKILTGPPVRDLTEPHRKHGETPGQVLKVIREGVKDAQMPGFQNTLKEDGLRAVAAYVFHLSGRPVPVSLRAD